MLERQEVPTSAVQRKPMFRLHTQVHTIGHVRSFDHRVLIAGPSCARPVAPCASPRALHGIGTCGRCRPLRTYGAAEQPGRDETPRSRQSPAPACDGPGFSRKSAVRQCSSNDNNLAGPPAERLTTVDPSATYAAVNPSPRSSRSHRHQGPRRGPRSSGHSGVGGTPGD